MSEELALALNARDAKNAMYEWKAHAEKLEQTVKVLQAELVKKDAHVAGLLAMINTLKAEAPNAPSLATVPETFKTGIRAGQKKTKLTKVYEAAHDAEARKNGIADPLSIRSN